MGYSNEDWGTSPLMEDPPLVFAYLSKVTLFLGKERNKMLYKVEYVGKILNYGIASQVFIVWEVTQLSIICDN